VNYSTDLHCLSVNVTEIVRNVSILQVVLYSYN
jgi:hypothetical protein